MTKVELQRHYYLAKEAEQIKIKLNQLRAQKDNVKSPIIDGMPKQMSNGSSIESLIVKYAELENSYKAKLFEIAEEQMKIEDAIDSLEPIERTLIRYRYIDHLKWENICILMNYSWRQVHNIHHRALQNLLNNRKECTQLHTT